MFSEIGVSKNRGTPKWMVYNVKNLLKWMGVPLFLETPNNVPLMIFPHDFFRRETLCQKKLKAFASQNLGHQGGKFMALAERSKTHEVTSMYSMVVDLVPLKGGIGGIVHPPIGRKNAT